jgi:hypothetical protein
MGLLDDAIREHLELKRLRGADPGNVARLEHEAFGPIHRGLDTDEHLDSGESALGAAAVEGQTLLGTQEGHGLELSSVGQETAELDMQSLLSHDAQGSAQPPGQLDALPNGPSTQSASNEDSLEWEIPGKTPDEKTGTTEQPGTQGKDDATEKPDEDVLEETPDFLQETPEHERLWFEQRPPRDFDFEK